MEFEHDGRSWPGLQTARRRLDDGRGWLAEAMWGVDQRWGRGKHLAAVPAERLRSTGEDAHWRLLAQGVSDALTGMGTLLTSVAGSYQQHEAAMAARIGAMI